MPIHGGYDPVEVSCPICGVVRRVYRLTAARHTFKGHCHKCKNKRHNSAKADKAPKPTITETKTRDCLTCGKRFTSLGSHNRICPSCSKTLSRVSSDPWDFYEVRL